MNLWVWDLQDGSVFGRECAKTSQGFTWQDGCIVSKSLFPYTELDMGYTIMGYTIPLEQLGKQTREWAKNFEDLKTILQDMVDKLKGWRDKQDGF